MSELAEAVALIRSRSAGAPAVGVILGSGLGAVADEIADRVAIPYREIPGFPTTTVPGHPGELVLGRLEGIGVAVMVGRVHLYEGYTPAQVGYPVLLLEALGVRTLVVTNAAGALNNDLAPGTLMLLEDHINLPGMVGMNPLVGTDRGRQRFVVMQGAYDPELRRAALEAGEKRGIRVAKGVYAMVAGPTYETTAEARLLRTVGADAVGMSTVPEVVVARWLGLRVAGISCITNTVLTSTEEGDVGHQAVLSVASAAAPDLAFLLRTIVQAATAG